MIIDIEKRWKECEKHFITHEQLLKGIEELFGSEIKDIDLKGLMKDDKERENQGTDGMADS